MPRIKKRRVTNLSPSKIKENVFAYLSTDPNGTIGGYLKAGWPKIGATTFHSYKKKFYEQRKKIEKSYLEKELKVDLDEKIEEHNDLRELEEKVEFLQWVTYGLEKDWFNRYENNCRDRK